MFFDQILRDTKTALGDQDPIVASLNFVQRYLSDTTIHTRITPSPIRPSKLDQDTITTLVNIGLIEELPPEKQHYTTTTIAFLVKEIRKGLGRRRTIFHTVVENETAPSPPSDMMVVTPLTLLSTRARCCSYAASRDFKSYFHQMAFTPPVSDFFIFQNTTPHSSRKYSLTRAAMGHKSSPACATTITKTITLLAIREAGVQVKYDIIIDDVLFMADTVADLQRVLKAFDEICEKYRVTIGSKQDPTQIINHRGIEFNLLDKSMKLKSDFVTKFTERLLTYKASPTAARMMSLLGMVSYAAQVIYLPGLTATFMRATTSANSTPPSDAFSDTEKTIMSNEPTPMNAAPQTPFGGSICSDATPQRMAALYIDQYGNTSTTTQNLNTPEPIQVAEANATILALSLVPKFKIAHVAHVHCDNMAWLYTASKPGRMAHPSLTDARNEFQRIVKEHNILPAFYYIKSSQNPVDEMSRQTDAELPPNTNALLQTSTKI